MLYSILLLIFTLIYATYCQNLCEDPRNFANQILMIMQQDSKPCLVTKDLYVYRFDRKEVGKWPLTLTQVKPTALKDTWPALYQDGNFSAKHRSFPHSARIYNEGQSEFLFMLGMNVELQGVDILAYMLDMFLHQGAANTSAQLWSYKPEMENIFSADSVWVSYDDFRPSFMLDVMQQNGPDWTYTTYHADGKNWAFEHLDNQMDMATKFLCLVSSGEMMFSSKACPGGQQWKDKILQVYTANHFCYLFCEQAVHIYRCEASGATDMERPHKLISLSYENFLGCESVITTAKNNNPKVVTTSGSNLKLVLIIGGVVILLVLVLLVAVWCITKSNQTGAKVRSVRRSPQSKKISAKKELNQSTKKGDQQQQQQPVSRSSKKAPPGGSSKKKPTAK